MTDKMEVWKKVNEQQTVIEDKLEELSSSIEVPEWLDEEFEAIKQAVQEIRSAVHGLIRPDLEIGK